MFFLKNKENIKFNYNSLNFFFIALIGLMIIYLYFVFDNRKKETFISKKHNFTKYSDDNIFDEFYVDFYDRVYVENDRINFEKNTTLPLLNNKKSKILDVGCGTGDFVNSLHNNDNIIVKGADISDKMIKLAKKKYPNNEFIKKNCSDSLNFYDEEFNVITCFYFTIYYFSNKEQFIKNCFKWLKPGGYLILHLVNLKKFDPSSKLPIGHENDSTEKDAIKLQHQDWDYSSKFIIDKSKECTTNSTTPNVKYNEYFKFNNNSVRMNQHNLFGTSQKNILSMAIENGFILREQKHMDKIGTAFQYLYILQKPE